MKRKALHITLLEDAVFSEWPSTEGGHHGLDYVPGSALLGAAAAKLYRHLSRETAYLLFHSGKVRFGNALPAAGSEHGYPMPYALHHAKGAAWKREQRLLPAEVVNLAAGAEARAQLKHAQPKQLRDGFITASGNHIEPALHYRMKTAIDPMAGRAANGQLFGYNALPAGTECVSELSADDDIPDELWRRLLAALEGDILLGRSRSAEYGRATLRLAEPAERTTENPESKVVLWLLSDLAACDAFGQPTLEPLPQWLGLPHGEVIWERTFLRSRRYAPWNAYRKSRDLERVVLQAGSVLTFALHEPWTDEHSARARSGLGLYREYGLGSVWVNPPMLFGPNPRLAEATCATAQADRSPLPHGEPPLIAWLRESGGARASRQEVAAAAAQAADQIMQCYTRARRYAGRTAEQPVGPSVSQWGSVLAVVKGAGPSWQADLFDANKGACRAGMEGWGDEFPHDGARSNFHDWLKARVQGNPNPRFVQELAHSVQSRLRKASSEKGDRK